MRVALRGEDSAVRRAVVAGGGEVVAPDDAEVILAVGERALADAALSRPDAPVLPLSLDEAAEGYYSRFVEAFCDRVEAFFAGEWTTDEHPLLSVEVDGAIAAEAALDVLLVTSEPARISEYAVRTERDRLDAFRADGVVVATPLGSDGYARAAGGPLLAPGTGLVVVPVSPFATRSERWVVPTEATMSVERDEGPVSLVVDGREVRGIDPGQRVRVRIDGAVSLVRPPAGT
ncbi:NAD(+)/NADH kinase [Halegenticoccus tardaugens]|uniref:NAD(+)/NADH kinase n=1 Tax=Halegenticoccus tardaugens TaxID=2071624 RepID=UPI0013E90B2C|nr:NAD(+)/NADH kinase [Halegenticoccus tardaugens]